MSDVFLTYATLISPLGESRSEHLNALRNERSGLTQCTATGFNGENWHQGRILSLEGTANRYVELLSRSLLDLKTRFSDEILRDPKTLFIISTTKAEIDALPESTFQSSYDLVDRILQPANPIRILSNACISGVMAINHAADLVHAAYYKQVFVIGIDVLSDFVSYGFQSLFALSDEPSRPFDANRKGISLGEACGIILVGTQAFDQSVRHLAGAVSNDANHISGPSRTGEGLFRAVRNTLLRAEREASAVDFISAHGTATLFNDEMESIAFQRLGLSQTPVNSFKGYFGHTLGAAGVIETLLSVLSINENELYKSLGYESQGTSEALNIITSSRKHTVSCVLKTASGFGGGNAALLMEKIA